MRLRTCQPSCFIRIPWCTTLSSTSASQASATVEELLTSSKYSREFSLHSKVPPKPSRSRTAMSPTQSCHPSNPYQQNFAYKALNPTNSNHLHASGDLMRARHARNGAEGAWSANWYPGRETYRAQIAPDSDPDEESSQRNIFELDAADTQRCPGPLHPVLVLAAPYPPPTQPLTPPAQAGTPCPPRGQRAVRRKPLPAGVQVPNYFLGHSKSSPEPLPSIPTIASSSSTSSTLLSSAASTTTPRSSVVPSRCTASEPAKINHLARVIDHSGNRPIAELTKIASRCERMASAVSSRLRRVASLAALV